MYDLVIDARMQWHGGIGTYLRNLMPYLDASGLRIKKIEQGPPIYSVAEQLWFPFIIPPCRLFWSPHFNVPLLPIRAKHRLVTIHDFYHLAHLPELTLPQKMYAKFVIRRAVKRSDRLIVGSEFTRQELYRFFPDFRGTVDLIHYGPGNVLPTESPISVPEPFFLFVGNLKPHKNLELLLKAFEQANLTEHLVVVGKKEGFIRGIHLHALRSVKQVHFLGQVKDAELTGLYKRATALVFPSLYEGWGFPPIEAMQAGCPVLAARAASIPEACGDAAFYFDPKNREELANLLKKISKEPSFRQLLIQKGQQRASEFSWEKCATAHLTIIRTA